MGKRDYILGVDWRAGMLSTIVAAVSFLIVLIVLAPLMGLSPFEPIRMIGAIALGPDILEGPATFDGGIFGAAMAVHLLLSLLYGFVTAAWVRERPPSQALAVGLLIGLGIYMLNFYVFIPAYPWFYAVRDLVTILAHLVFGGAAALFYVWMTQGWRQLLPSH